ncbi:MAG: hypothetical protein M5R41_08080 [Bacteroidia bacterium]|nr:hypothetical protein [Bacteroidia bacterium]
MKITGILIIFCTVLSLVAQAQEQGLRDMSDGEFLQLFTARNEQPVHTAFTGGEQPVQGRKCSFDLMAEAARRLPLMQPDDAQLMRRLLAPPVTQTSVLSPNGRFRVHFDTTGRHAPAMIDEAGNRIPGSYFAYADSVGTAFEHVYEVEIARLGYEVPPMQQGFNEYQIYIQEYFGNYYGETAWTGIVVNPGTIKQTYATYIQIDNDYREYYSKGLNGLRVTAAHEYHHAIQLGRYGLWSEDQWMHEMTSTYYEEYVYPEINDYLIYVRTFMKYPDRALYSWGNQGYELVLWPIMLERRYGPGLMREFWNGLKQKESITAMRDGLASAGGDFASDFCTWAKVNYFTGWRWNRLDPVEYSDGEMFPSVVFTATQPLNAGSALFNGTVLPLSSQYFRVARGLDTVAFVVSNVDMSAALARSGSGVGFTLEVRETAPDASWQSLTNGWAYKFTAATGNALCMHVLDAGATQDDRLREPWPNPLLLAESSRMHFPLPRNLAVNRVELVVYTVGMVELYRKDNLPVQLDDLIGAYVAWDIQAGEGTDLASGVYFYVLSYGSERRSGKFAVIGR